MANNGEKQQIDDNVQDAEVVSDEAKQYTTNRWLWLAVVLLLILSVSSSGWLYLQQQQFQQLQQQQLERLNSDTDAVTQALQQNRQQLGEVQQQQQQLGKQLNELLAREQYSSTDLLRLWALQEIEYLLSMANQRALLAHDVAGAQQALTLADKQLEALSDYRLHPLRALIAEERMALDSLADIDIAGMAIQLQTAANRIDSLRVVKGPEVNSAKAPITPDSSADADWRQALKAVWQQIRSLVVIRHDQNGEAAVLVPEQRYFLYQNLRLQLESARLALLNADAASYEHSLQTAADWLKRYFTGDERDAMLNTLTQLQQQNIDINIPDISASLNWLVEYQQ
ncbi:uroporphyrinogen-III C-methyltransferase [Methylophaga sp. OBS4]|uniref:uroporphyrinogen-III C-methyltransferase n=1 Tax=Methylophaga sp. OBS4 TaxID=2991935 RepID=UPI00225ACF8D|nr:uroporphyrinogen-III C-methyltransferase [Methylophaga sp. OBS4]MCX4187985.1 uroporphyrinogen-III C-methyltransferase [Methylophaga sp. OBS4]